MTTTNLLVAAIVGYCLAPVLLVLTIHACATLREWRHNRLRR